MLGCRPAKTELEMIAATDIAHGRKAGGQRATSVLGHSEDPESRRIAIARARIGKPLIRKVNVTVDEARQNRRSGEIETVGVWRWRDVRAHSDDPVALEKHRTGAQRRRARPVDEGIRCNQEGHGRRLGAQAET